MPTTHGIGPWCDQNWSRRVTWAAARGRSWTSSVGRAKQAGLLGQAADQRAHVLAIEWARAARLASGGLERRPGSVARGCCRSGVLDGPAVRLVSPSPSVSTVTRD